MVGRGEERRVSDALSVSRSSLRMSGSASGLERVGGKKGLFEAEANTLIFSLPQTSCSSCA